MGREHFCSRCKEKHSKPTGNVSNLLPKNAGGLREMKRAGEELAKELRGEHCPGNGVCVGAWGLDPLLAHDVGLLTLGPKLDPVGPSPSAWIPNKLDRPFFQNPASAPDLPRSITQWIPANPLRQKCRRGN